MDKDTDYNHIYPLNDLKEHILDGVKCWCNPTLDFDWNTITHNSMDNREQFETGDRKPS